LRSLFKVILVSTLVVLIGVSLFFALTYLSKFEGPSRTFPMAQGVYDGLQLTMTLEKTEYNLSEPININLTLTNINNKSVNIQFGPDTNQELYDFQVYNSTNSTVYLGSYEGQSGIMVTPPFEAQEKLDPGQSSGWVFSWLQEGYTQNVPRGTYYIIGLSSFSLPDYQQKSITIETTPIQIKIS